MIANANWSTKCICSENFLSFSPSLTALKQEPQTDQLKPNAKISLDSGSSNNNNNNSNSGIGKSDKSPLGEANHSPQRTGQDSGVGAAGGSGKHELNAGIICGCGTPQGSPAATDFELNGNANGNEATAEKSRAASGIGAYTQARK